jgi:hypothetical protein
MWFPWRCPVGSQFAVERAVTIGPHARSTDPAFLIPSGRGMVPYSSCGSVVSPKTICNFLFVWTLVDPMLSKRVGDWRSDAYMLYIGPHTPEGLVSLPVDMTRACAGLG